MPDSTSKKDVTITSGQTTGVSFGQISTKACRVEGAVYYDTASSFIAPEQKPVLEKVFLAGMSFSPGDGGDETPIPKPDRFLLILGHADQVGSRGSNVNLSKRRALAALAVFNLDTDTWDTIYEEEKWGKPEIKIMSGEVDEETNDEMIAHYQSDGESRIDLIRRYLDFLRPGWLPRQSPPIKPLFVEIAVSSNSSPVIACSTDHPVIDAPGTAVLENRRAEFLYFRQRETGLTGSPPPALYRSWKAECSGGLITVDIYIEDEYEKPYNGRFYLTLPGRSLPVEEYTDERGIWTGEIMPTGLYTIKMPGMEITPLSPDSKKSYQYNYEKNICPPDSKIRIQVIDPNKWFVPKQNSLSKIPQFSRGNIVEPLIDGKAMLKAVYDAFDQIITFKKKAGQKKEPNHYIYIAVWRLDRELRLLGLNHPDSVLINDDEEENGVTPKAINNNDNQEENGVILKAIKKGAEVKALLWDDWDFWWLGFDNEKEQKAIDKKYGKHRGEAILDNETLNYGSHHQKAIVVKGPEGLTAFCGGIDLALERWDTPEHKFPTPGYETNPGPWHDVHTRIRGPAAGDIETNFRERWNNHPGKNDNGRTDVEKHPVPDPLPGGPHLVQTLRTFPPKKKYKFAPNGELGILEAYKKAIANAREYIYIEDQYFVNYEIAGVNTVLLQSYIDYSIAGSIANALKRGLKGKVIVVIPRKTDDRLDIPEAFWYHRFNIIYTIKKKYRSKFEVYYLNTNPSDEKLGKDIYVHSKLMIVDDIWAIIGSANVNYRSMTHDSEIGVAVIDGTIENGRRKFARDLRINLWSEHLKVKKDNVDDPMEGINLWPENPGEVKGHVAVYPVYKGDPSDILDWNTKIDPDGR